MRRVAIVIVTHNSADEIGGCLDALRHLDDVETIVVDNASTDRTREEITTRDARYIPNPTNVGFAAAVNMGARATTAPLLLLLNPDAHLLHGLDALIARFDSARTGAVGGMLVGEDGQPQAGFMARNLPTATTLVFEILGINRLWPSNPVNWHYRCLEKDPMTAALVEQPAGAFLMFPRAVWERLGGFDERFAPIWFEDVDFCARVKALNLQVFYEPKAVARHSGGHSIAPLPTAAREIYWYGSLLEYAAKHYRPNSFRAVCLAVMLGSGIRAFRGVRIYGRVAGLAMSWFFRARDNGGVRVG